MVAIFLSYRRADTAGHAGRLSAALQRRFGPGTVFQDIEAIAPGADFAQAIEAAVTRCEVLLVLIGDTWLTESDAEGRRRLDDPRDFVRLEIAAALRAGTLVLPLLLEGARMPPKAELPPEIALLARRQALELSDTRWDYDFERLVRTLSREGLARGGRRRLILGLAVAAALAMAVAGAWVAFLRPPDLSGRWVQPDGNWWVVTQEGSRLTIEEVHHESREVWRRGTGNIDGARVDLELDMVFETGRSLQGQVRIAAGGLSLSGELEQLPEGIRRPLLLVRP
jgi:hypothetical protein